jgi:hypothetical protein
MSAPWIAPLANSPQAVGLKNGGLSEITSDILYPASRLQDGDFQSGRTLEWRWRADSSRHFLPRESRMFIEYEFAFGETVDGRRVPPPPGRQKHAQSTQVENY